MNSLKGGLSLKKIYNKIIFLFVLFTLLLGSVGPAVSHVNAEYNGIETEELELEAEQESEAEQEQEPEAEQEQEPEPEPEAEQELEAEPEPEAKEKSPEKTSAKELEELKEEDAKAEKKAQSVEKVETEDVEEEEDELAENYPAIATPAIPMPMMRMAKSSGGLQDTIGVDKTAKRTPGCRTFEVNLNITGEPQQAPVDVVLVIDKSGSMNERVGGYGSNTRLFYAKQAAVNFAGRVLGLNGIPGSRVSVVSFSGPEYATGGWFDPQRHYGQQNQATTNLDLSSDLATVTNRINSITAVGGTNTEAGFKQGQSVIQGSTSNQNPNSNKVVIMLTDGLPTASNGNPYADTTNINHVHIQSAINAGKNIYQNDIADVFTIGLTTGMYATEKALADNILTQAQNKGYYPAPLATDLDAIFNAISQSLGYAATNAKVVDKIGDNFDLIESSLPAGATYNAATREITWNPGTIVTGASLTYKVVAKPDFPGGLADTNEFAKLTYKDIFGVDGKTKDFPVPNVNVPTLIKVSLTDATINSGDSINLGSGTDADGENYMSPVTGGDNDGKTFTYEWRKVGDDTVISNDKNPSVSPTEDTQYELTVIDSNGCKAKATMWVRVTSLTDVTITKKVTGNMGDMKGNFPFIVEIEGEDEPREFILSHGDSYRLENIPRNAQLTLTETDNRDHDVTVTINSSEIFAQEGKFIIDLAELTGEDIKIEVTNHRNILIDTGVTLDSLLYILILLGAVFGLTIKVILKKNYV